MMHISEDQIMELAEKTANNQILTSEQIDCLEHLKTCRECYEKFCVFSMLVDVTSGNYIKTLFAPQRMMNEVISKSKRTIYAVLDILVTRIDSVVKVTMEQVQKLDDKMEFSPALAMATRGTEDNQSNGVRYEEVEDEKTFIFYDPDKREIVVQLSVALIDTANVDVSIKYETGEDIAIPMTKKGKVYYGTLSGVIDDKFTVVIASSEE